MELKDLKLNKISILNEISTSFNQEKEVFLENVGVLLGSGLDILNVFKALKHDFKSERMKKTIEYIILKLEDGYPLWQALKDVSFINDSSISLIKIGEKTGRLPENFKVIVQQRRKDQDLKNRIQSAMSYPTLVLILAVIILLGIVWFILPSLSEIYGRLNQDLPPITKFIVWLGSFMSEYGAIVVPSLLAFLLSSLYFLFFHNSTKKYGQTFLFKYTWLKEYFRDLELSRFTFYTGTLLEAGVPINEALKSLISAGNFYPYFKFYDYLYTKVLEGYSFERCFKELKDVEKFIPTVTQSMITNGEKSGHLSNVLLTLGQIYETRTEHSTKSIATYLEPALLIVVWIAVAAIAIGIILPIYSIIGTLGDSASGSQNISDNSFPTPTVDSNISPTATPTVAVIETPSPTIDLKPESKLIVTSNVNIRQNASTASKIIR